MKLKLKAPAKINLGLSITGKLDNGFHEVSTIYTQIRLFDLIELENLIERKIDFFDKTNLVYRAAETLIKDRGVRIKLTKNIPIGSGLGGASSDAAAILLGLNKLWNLNLSQNELIEAAKKLGSDVAYFLIGGTQQETQGGEQAGKFKNLGKLISGWLVVCWPGITISSKEAYQKVEYDQIGKMPLLWHNDFEIWTLKQYPEIRKIEELMLKNGAKHSLMSGKGSAVWGEWKDKSMAFPVYNNLKNKYPKTYLTQIYD